MKEILEKHINLLSRAIEEDITQKNENIPEPKKLRLDGFILEAENRLCQLISVFAQIQSSQLHKNNLSVSGENQ